MHELTGRDLAGVVGQTIEGYRVEAARVKKGPFARLRLDERRDRITFRFT